MDMQPLPPVLWDNGARQGRPVPRPGHAAPHGDFEAQHRCPALRRHSRLLQGKAVVFVPEQHRSAFLTILRYAVRRLQSKSGGGGQDMPSTLHMVVKVQQLTNVSLFFILLLYWLFWFFCLFFFLFFSLPH